MKPEAGRKIATVLAAALLWFILFSVAVPEAQGEKLGGSFWSVESVCDSIIRLHVVADSNEQESQSIKMDLVKQVLQLLAADRALWLDGDFRLYLLKNLNRLERRLQQYAEMQMNHSPEIKVSLVREEFPLRVYGRYIYPPGEYTALKVVIGSGEGDNWWCLLFPTFCLSYARAADVPEIKEPSHEAAGQQEHISENPDQQPPLVEISRWKSFIAERIKSWFRDN